jgi:hypothetical protein
MLHTIFRIVLTLFSPDTTRLAKAIKASAPMYLTPATAVMQVVAAKIYATPEIPTELLLGMAMIESRYSPRATSRVENGVRTTGIPRWTSPPSYVTGPYFCGVTQAEAGLSWEKCIELRDVFVAYKTTVEELKKWLKSPSCRSEPDRMQCALWGYGGGHPAIEAKTSTYPNRVMSRAALLKKAHIPGS